LLLRDPEEEAMSHPLRSFRTAAGLVLAATLLAAPAGAQSRVGQVAEEVGLGLGAASLTALYLPAKVFVSATGALVALSAWGITGGQREPALDILETTGGGDWLVAEQHLRGDRRFYVFAPEEPGERDAYAHQR
jgi:hypothetical protein